MLAWNLITAPLREMCDDVVFSIPPYTFFVEYEEAFAGFGAEVLFATVRREGGMEGGREGGRVGEGSEKERGRGR